MVCDAETGSSGASYVDSRTNSSPIASPVSEFSTPEKAVDSSREDNDLSELFSENAAAKIWRVAESYLEKEVCFPPFSPLIYLHDEFGRVWR